MVENSRLDVNIYPMRGKLLLPLLLGVLLLLGLAGCGTSDAGGSTGGTGSTATTPQSNATSGELQVSLSVDPDPPQAGPATFTVEVKDSEGKPVEGAQVSMSGRHVGMAHGGIEGQLEEQGGGRYQAEGSFSMSGTWRFDVEAVSGSLAPKTQTFEIAVR